MFVLCCNRQFHSIQTDYGKQHETIAKRQYENLLGVTVQPTGLTLLPDAHYIGASCDGMVGSTVIEIKCPFSGREKKVDELVYSGYEHLTKLDNGQFVLNEQSSYYCQVQGEMAITGCKLCHLVVWTPLDMQIITEQFNDVFGAKNCC